MLQYLRHFAPPCLQADPRSDHLPLHNPFLASSADTFSASPADDQDVLLSEI